ncbi:MAG: DedA family protein [Planctomycetota bacterium]|nr:DedA family protein [Planctomycetota bacterium]
MELLLEFKDLILHVDRHLDDLIVQWGPWIYVLMFTVIFCETGLVVTPFLPGDSLLFALGAFAARINEETNEPMLNLPILLVSLTVAAILGDTVNYWIGSRLGPRLFQGEKFRLLNPKHLEKTHEFFERYGGKTIIIARFAPIVRTFAPFVAGMGRMTYQRFMAYNVVGGVLWIALFLVGGYLFGNLESVRKNFTLVILGIIVVSILPGVFEYWRERRRLKALEAGSVNSVKQVER